MSTTEVANPRSTRASTRAEPGDPHARIKLFDKAWRKLTTQQQQWLIAWKECRFNKARVRRKFEKIGVENSTEWRWCRNEAYAFCKKVMKVDAVADVLERERLVLRHDDCVEALLEPKPILYMGEPTGFYETEPAAAAKVNETLLRVGGHLRDEQAAAPTVGPALIVQVTNKIGGEIVSQTTVGVVPQLPAPEEDAWLDTR